MKLKGEFGLEDVGDEVDTGNKLEDVVVNDDDSVDEGELQWRKLSAAMDCGEDNSGRESREMT